ncbi:MAG: putative quinol monooxygenase [Smithellaceae bacterium]
MITVIAKLPIKEGKMDEALAAFKTLMAGVAAEEGTTLYSLNKDPKAPNMLIVVEQYKDKAAFDFHSSTPHFKTFFAAGGAFIGGKPEISLMEEIAAA